MFLYCSPQKTAGLLSFDVFCFWLHWVFVALCELSLVASNGGSHCAGCSCCRGSGAQGLGSRGAQLHSCGPQAELLCVVWRLLGPGVNPCPLHWQAGSYLLRHQGSPSFDLLIKGQCIYEKVLESFYQVYLCNQSPDKREKVTSTSDPPLCPVPVPVPHCITTLLTSNSTGSCFKDASCRCSPIVCVAPPSFVYRWL